MNDTGFLPQLTASFANRFDLRIPVPVRDWILGSHEIARIWETANSLTAGDLFSKLLQAMDVELSFREADCARIPSTGPAVIAANHPHGLLDGLVLGAMVSRVRPDFRILANSLLSPIPGLNEYLLPIDPFDDPKETHRNSRSLLSAYRYLRKGGALIVFPAGEVSYLQPGRGVADPPWNPSVFELAARAGAPVIPFFVHGRNGAGFQIAGMVHPFLRTALLGRELINKRTYRVQVAVGRRLKPESLQQRSVDSSASYVRQRTYALRGRDQKERAKLHWRRTVPVAPPVSADRLAGEIDRLPAECRLLERGDCSVYFARAVEIPACLEEIGRLREKTFREAGEGTGRALDLDRFDEHYGHLFLWNHAAREIVGAYRLGDVAETRRRMGLRGFYTHTLFRYDEGFVERLSPGLELGRSFIRAEYQKQTHALSNLWKGIGALLARRPEIRYLFGPVSISADYSAVARELIVAYFEAHRDRREPVVPRTPPKPRAGTYEVTREIRTVAELSDLIADVDPAGREIPILLRHYLNLGATVLGFNVDSKFANALDALIVLDLDNANPAMLARYTGVRRGY